MADCIFIWVILMVFGAIMYVAGYINGRYNI